MDARYQREVVEQTINGSVEGDHAGLRAPRTGTYDERRFNCTIVP